jgi:hypothetical protein
VIRRFGSGRGTAKAYGSAVCAQGPTDRPACPSYRPLMRLFSVGHTGLVGLAP